ncbi:MAG: ABC transporter permease [Bacteroidia bacterium]|jgi:ABC-2 type transport system permease protein|tara:strand:+ start:269 stop:1585 length:1317 start_codon:yes stop_codon:yes gene_type:complete
MSKIGTITAREYLTRIKKKSFILMTLLTPLLITLFYSLIIWISVGQSTATESQHIVVVDPTGIFINNLENQEGIYFIYKDYYTTEDLLKSDSIDGVITIVSNYTIGQAFTPRYESMSSLSVNNSQRLERAFRNVLREQKLTELGIKQSAIDSLRSSVSINQFTVDPDGSTKKSNMGINTAVGMALAFLIYFFIFLYGVQVMKGVIEEKTSRIVELIVSTVKPFQLMMGKVLGIALVGLSQLVMWIILTALLMGVIGLIVDFNISDLHELEQLGSNTALTNVDLEQLQFISDFLALPLGKIFGVFLFFFMGGYLFYGALFAAIGSAVDSETDTQQFMLPMTMPLIFSIAVSFSIVVGDPNGTLATWMSIIPFTSPVTMMVRLPFMGEELNWQIYLSMAIMLMSIVAAIAVAGKIYRTGILMYGKKASYKELAKWLFYKN